jgi:hypothetical protein
VLAVHLLSFDPCFIRNSPGVYPFYLISIFSFQVSDDELASMIAVADPNGTGEIDFEQFCYIVLGVTRVDFGKWIAAHMQKPISVLSLVFGHRDSSALDSNVPHAFDLTRLENQYNVC